MRTDTTPFFLGDGEVILNNLSDDVIGNLLEATPFTKEGKINFSYRITEEFFFDKFYAEVWKPCNDEKTKKRNVEFDEKVRKNLSAIHNKDSKADFFHIWGYAGCGKTTYVRKLLSDLNKKDGLEYSVVDFELCHSVKEALITAVSEKMSGEIKNLYNFYKILLEGKYFVMIPFGTSLEYLEQFVKMLSVKVDKSISGEVLLNAAEISSFLYSLMNLETDGHYEKTLQDDIETYNVPKTYMDYIEFLLMLIFLHNIYNMMMNISSYNEFRSNIILFDNVDSMDNQFEEFAMLKATLEFINSCKKFYDVNLKNTNEYVGRVASSFINNTKFSFFMTSRVVTVKQLIAIEPDFDRYLGIPDHEMPENFYSHEEIFENRLKYYHENENSISNELIKKLDALNVIKNIMYKSTSFRRLMNGNVRYCFGTINALYDKYHNRAFVQDCFRLNSEASTIRQAGHGANGIVLAMLIDYFKEAGIFKNKLHLSTCIQDNNISLSRIVLTIIHESGGQCSLLDIFNSIPKIYCTDDLCNMIYDLSENSRLFWRRLIVFERIIPKNKKDLRNQLIAYLNGQRDSNDYTMLNLCRSGYAYLDNVIPHFEFMLARCTYPNGTLDDVANTPLYCQSSLKKVGRHNEKYGFEIKVDKVFKSVSECVLNSEHFAKQVMKQFNYDEEGYMKKSNLNYHDIEPVEGSKQSYIGRLVFGHVGYIERYRRYLYKKGLMRRDINEKLTKSISGYLELYLNGPKCIHTDEHDEAYLTLARKVEIIKNSNYKDYKTRIEVFA